MAVKNSTILKSLSSSFRVAASRAFSSISVGSDLVSSAPDVSLQKARSWYDGVSSKFATTSLHDIFKGKKVVIFGLPGHIYWGNDTLYESTGLYGQSTIRKIALQTGKLGGNGFIP